MPLCFKYGKISVIMSYWAINIPMVAWKVFDSVSFVTGFISRFSKEVSQKEHKK